MLGPSHCRAEAAHARRLAEITIQLNVEEVLRRVAEEFDHLAEDVVISEVHLSDSETPEHL
jgi:hypothetical protein